MLKVAPSAAVLLLALSACSANNADSGNAGGSSSGGASGGAQTTSGAGGMSAAGNGGTVAATNGGAAQSGAPQGGFSQGGSAQGGGGAGNGGNVGSGGGPGGGTAGALGGAGSGQGGSSSATGGRSTGGTGAVGGAATGGAPPSGGAASLGQKYASYFPIGAAVDAQSYMTHAPVLTKHFNSITPENDMKFDALEPSENSFTYTTADKIVDFAVKNNMKIRGHALVWHRQNPAWLFSNGSGGTVTKEVLLSRMKNHIAKVVSHYRGKVYAWDVVNEAMRDDGTYRTGNETGTDQSSQWYAIMGKSFIAEAFKAAHDADPDAKLFYNDFYDYIPAKQQGIHAMLKELLDAGVPVHGVGMQCHLNIQGSTDPANQSYHQTVENLENAIKLYSSLGIAVQVTELDLSLYIPGMTYTMDQFYTQATFTTALKTKQADRYRAFFELFRNYKSVITGVTFWGIADDNTWLSEFTSKRQDFPLLFDNNHNPKPAYDAVVGF